MHFRKKRLLDDPVGDSARGQGFRSKPRRWRVARREASFPTQLGYYEILRIVGPCAYRHGFDLIVLRCHEILRQSCDTPIFRQHVGKHCQTTFTPATQGAATLNVRGLNQSAKREELVKIEDVNIRDAVLNKMHYWMHDIMTESIRSTWHLLGRHQTSEIPCLPSEMFKENPQASAYFCR